MSELGGPRTLLQTECAASSFNSGNEERVRVLLDSGLDPNELDGFQRSALNLLCSQTGHSETVRLLIEAGANVMSQDMWGRTPLHWCADRGWLDSAYLLLEKGASVSVTTKNGDSVLMWAAKAGHLSLVEVFLKAGCDPRLSNNREERALDVAKDDVIRTLIACKLAELEGTTSSSPVSPSAEPSPKKVRSQPLPSVAGHDHSSVKGEEKTEINLEEVKPSSTSSIPTSTAAFSSYNKQTAPGPGPKKLKITLKRK